MELRVAHVIATLRIGGAERHLVNLLNAMPCQYRAAVFLGPQYAGPSFHEDLDPAIEQHFVKVRRRSLPIGIAQLANLFRKQRVNVVHTHMFESNLYGALAARLAGVPVVATSEHGENPWKNSLHRWLERRVISPLADARFCVSPQILAIRRDRDGVPADKLRLTVNGTPLPPPVPPTPGNPEPLIGAVGRLIAVKDHARLLEAAALLRGRGFKFRLCIAGDGPERDNLRQLATTLGLEDIVHFPGMVAEIQEWYRRFDIYASSSLREGQPMALLEAMAYGLPIVSTDVGSAESTIREGVAGFIVPPANSQALADALGKLLEDEALRREFGQNARRRVEAEFSIDSVANGLLKFYANTMTKKSVLRARATP
jgi:glycosyltransferase involved in cell wall biosynthesis